MLNLVVVPLMPLVGALTANLSELIRGENKEFHPNLSVGIKTFTLAAAAFTLVWFALLITAITTGGGSDVLAGIEVLALFMIGLGLYLSLKATRFLSETAQLWMYRLALPVTLTACLLVSLFG
ncbi:hypothetical protein [Shewanella sp. UCD-KL12]|uniref:hypothetical protein n=1 Tax=Shewanella sp. UCD-KL12 TaxID=1917163 RepID=UPI000970CF87|nr:hypothetical protein [Shewanella sp. UCD-KL12]